MKLTRTLPLAIALAAPPLCAQEPPVDFDRPSEYDAEVSPGPAVGETVPSFRAPDQQGRERDFDSLKGPNGALLLFFRSADW